MGNISVAVRRGAGNAWWCDLSGPGGSITLFSSDKQNAANGAHDLYEAVQNAINIDGESGSLKAVAEATRDGDTRMWGVVLYMGSAPMAALKSFGHKTNSANKAADFADLVNRVLNPGIVVGYDHGRDTKASNDKLVADGVLDGGDAAEPEPEWKPDAEAPLA